ncbi:MAG: cation transporter [Parvibaculum sp.]|jgi:Co/Zn/Cd efflux system component|uniref:cation transporter n=1 Tax=Parvibaculum sp. TaxID=2024848 RepID=UPI0032ED5F45
MSEQCCEHEVSEAQLRDTAYRRVLWAALLINGFMFAIEMLAGLAANSVSLQADALDFLGDTATYAISLFVLGMSLSVRAKAALAKGAAMALLGFWVIGSTFWHIAYGAAPEAMTMGAVGAVALTANVAVFALLWRHRSGDSNMRSVWLCSRNDVLGNCAVLLAAFGVFGTGTAWPDLSVAAIMSALALQGAWTVFRQALGELRKSSHEETGRRAQA